MNRGPTELPPMIELTVRSLERQVMVALSPETLSQEIEAAVNQVCTPEKVQAELVSAIEYGLKRVIAQAVDHAITRSEDLTKYLRLQAEREIQERMKSRLEYLEKYGE